MTWNEDVHAWECAINDSPFRWEGVCTCKADAMVDALETNDG